MSQSSCPGMWDGGVDSAMPGWPTVYARGSQLLLRATLPSSDPEACRPWSSPFYEFCQCSDLNWAPLTLRETLPS